MDLLSPDVAAPAIVARPRAPRVMKTAGLRFALFYAVQLGLTALALALFLWWETAGLLDRQTDAAITADMRGLSERWAEGRIPALGLTIQERISQNIDDDAIYLLVDPQMHRVAGNLNAWPRAIPPDADWFELPIERAGARSMARVEQLALPDGFRLLVGRDVQVRSQLVHILKDALFWALLIVLALAAVGGLVVRSVFRRAISAVSTTTDAIAAGDLTQRVRLSGRHDEFDRVAEMINDMLDRIARLMDGVRQVSNAIAHDLRTPIARARARLEDAATHAHTPDELRAAIERATTDLDDITSVFQALLRIAEIEAGSRRSAFAGLDLAPVLTDLAELYSAAAEERGLTLETTLPETLPAYGDRALIQQAVANLLDNAVKFAPPGSTIRLQAERAPGGPEISVADEGVGIPEADRARAPERFFRGEAARQTPGSGLGLALVQAVAQLHGGALRLEDANPGLRAVLTLSAGEGSPAP
jgi:signal transduction histidine kinase